MKAQVMTRAWEIAKAGQQTFGGKVSAYFAEALRMAWAEAKSQTAETKEEMIKRLEGLGFRRWTNYGKDRMYINASYLGLECQYKAGRINKAYFDGEKMTISYGYRYKEAKTYLDLKTMEFHSDYADLLEAAKKLAKIA